jgi:hypothetical protein
MNPDKCEKHSGVNHPQNRDLGVIFNDFLVKNLMFLSLLSCCTGVQARPEGALKETETSSGRLSGDPDRGQHVKMVSKWGGVAHK